MRLALALIIILAAACTPASPAPAQIDPPFPTAGLVGETARVYAVESGWFEGRAAQYYNLGTNTLLNPDDAARVLVEPVWVFATGVNDDGSPIKLEGQASLFDSAPGDAGYSDLWQVFFIKPAAGYAPNSITSIEALQKSGLTIEKKPMLVNCPFVPPGSSLADNSKELIKGWVNGTPVVYFDFGVTSAKPGKVYVFVTGFDAAGGQSQLVPSQHFVFSASRGSAGYSDFWVVQWVKVDASYKADSIRSAADIVEFEVEPSTMVVNYPQK